VARPARSQLSQLGERFGSAAGGAARGVVHAASAVRYRPCAQLWVRCGSATGPAADRHGPHATGDRLGAGAVAGAARCVTSSLIAGAVRRFFERVHPRLAVIVREPSGGPNMYREGGRRRVPVVLARRGCRRDRSAAIGAGSPVRDPFCRGRPWSRHRARGMPSVPGSGRRSSQHHVTGNLSRLRAAAADRERERGSVSSTAPPRAVGGRQHARRGRGAGAARGAAARARGDPDALLVLAPRHPPGFAAWSRAWLHQAASARCAARREPPARAPTMRVCARLPG